MILHRFGRPFETFTADFKNEVTCFKFCNDLEEKRNASIVMQLVFLNKDYPNKDYPTKIETTSFKWKPLDGEFKKSKLRLIKLSSRGKK